MKVKVRFHMYIGTEEIISEEEREVLAETPDVTWLDNGEGNDPSRFVHDVLEFDGHPEYGWQEIVR